MLKIEVLFLLFFCFPALSYTPTIESLLRNANNSDIGNNTVVADFDIKSIKDDFDTESLTSEPNFAARFLVYNQDENFPKLLQAEYQGGRVDSSLLYRYKVHPFHAVDKLISNKEKIEARFFYSLMKALLVNDGKMLLNLANMYGANIKDNESLLNSKKLNLLKNYKEYLEQAKLAKDEKDPSILILNNPLAPEDPEKREEVSKILIAPFLEASDSIKKIKENNNFYWEIRANSFYAKFDDNHFLKKISLKTEMGEVVATFGKFIIFGSNLLFPEYILLSDLAGKKYEIKMKKLSLIKDSPSNNSRRLRKYDKLINDNKINSEPVKPLILI